MPRETERETEREPAEETIVQYKVGSVALTTTTLLNVNAVIEHIVATNGSYYFKEAIYIKMKKFQSSGKSINMLVNSLELRAMSYAMKDLIANPIRIKLYNGQEGKEVDFEKISNSGVMKKLTLECAISHDQQKRKDEEKYSIKIQAGSKNNNNFEFLAINVDKYKFLAFSDKLARLADEVDSNFFKFEQHKDKIDKKNNFHKL